MVQRELPSGIKWNKSALGPASIPSGPDHEALLAPSCKRTCSVLLKGSASGCTQPGCGLGPGWATKDKFGCGWSPKARGDLRAWIRRRRDSLYPPCPSKGPSFMRLHCTSIVIPPVPCEPVKIQKKGKGL